MSARPRTKLVRAGLLQREVDLVIVAAATLRRNGAGVSQLGAVDNRRRLNHDILHRSLLVRILLIGSGIDALLVRQHLAIRRNRARAVQRVDRLQLGGIRRRRTWIWWTDYVNELEFRFGLQDLLDALGILDAGHLQKYLMGTLRAVSLERRLRNAESVDATVDDVERLCRRIVCEHALGCRRHGPANLVPGRAERPSRSVADFDLLFDSLSGLFRFGRICQFDHYPMVAAANVRATAFDLKTRFSRCVLSSRGITFSQIFEVLLRLYSHYQVRTALKIQSEMNI